MSAESSALPRNSRRTMRRAIVIPKIVFSGTTMSAILSVSSSALTASGSVIESQTGASPPEKVCVMIIPTGTIRSSAREASATNRSPYLTIMLRVPAVEGGDGQEHHEREREQHDRHRG